MIDKRKEQAILLISYCGRRNINRIKLITFWNVVIFFDSRNSIPKIRFKNEIIPLNFSFPIWGIQFNVAFPIRKTFRFSRLCMSCGFKVEVLGTNKFRQSNWAKTFPEFSTPCLQSILIGTSKHAGRLSFWVNFFCTAL